MVCRHCPRPPWRHAPLALFLPPLLLSLGAFTAAHRAATGTSISSNTPSTQPIHTHHHAHQYSHSHRQQASSSILQQEKGCEDVTPLNEELLPRKTAPIKCQTCYSNALKCEVEGQGCHSLEETLCSSEVGEEREGLLRNTTFRYCPHLVLHSAMCHDQVQKVVTGHACYTVARHLQELDEMVGRVLQQQQDVMARVDCEQEYSVRQTCSGCKEVYQYWVCSQLLPYYLEGNLIKPCRSFCHEVERKCPYLIPKDKPVAGEPTFLCEDPLMGKIENVESSYGSDSCCYHMCPHNQSLGHLNERSQNKHPPSICTTPRSTATTTTATTTTTITTTSTTTINTITSPDSTSSSLSNLQQQRQQQQTQANPSQCLSDNGADSCLRHSSPVTPISNSSTCSLRARKHCWTRTALYILLLCLVRTCPWLPRGFT